MVEKDYYGFLDEVAEKLQAAMSSFTDRFRVNVKDVEKPNGMSYRGIVVADQQTRMGVTIDMDKHYKTYMAGKSVDAIVELVQQQARDGLDRSPDVDIKRSISEECSAHRHGRPLYYFSLKSRREQGPFHWSDYR